MSDSYNSCLETEKELWLKEKFLAVNPMFHGDRIICWFASHQEGRKRFRVDNHLDTTLDEFKALVELSFL